MTRLFAIMALLCVGSQLAGAFNAPQDDKAYYYFRDEKIELNVNKERIYVYFRNEPDVASELIERYGLRPTDRKAAYYQCLAGEKTYSDEIASQEFVVDKDRYADVINNVKEHPMVLSVQRVFGIGNPTPTADVFYVNLKSGEYYDEMVSLAEEMGTEINGTVGFDNWYELRTTTDSWNDALGCTNCFYESGICKDVDPAFLIRYEFMTTNVTDTDYSEQWAIDNEGVDIHVADVWDITKGNTGVKVAVIDSGILEGHDEFAGTHFDGWYNTVSYAPVNKPFNPHGTNVTGIIAANHNQGLIAGVAPGVTVMDVLKPEFDDDVNDLFFFRLYQGIEYAVNNGADVINCSWGITRDSINAIKDDFNNSLLTGFIQYALSNGRGGKGCVVVFASGNDSCNYCSSPGTYVPDAIIVGALSKEHGVCTFSNYGQELDVVAPGENILTTSLQPGHPETTNDYMYVDGTSFAAAYVSGIAALILSVAPDLTGKQVTDLIERAAQKIHPESYTYSYDVTTHVNGWWDEKIGYGLVDAYASMVKDCTTQCPADGKLVSCFVNIHDLMMPNNEQLEIKSYVSTKIDGLFYVSDEATLGVNTPLIYRE